jgi:hypothetical protein
MAAGSIAGISLDIVQGLPAVLKIRVDKWEVPGLDGYGAQTFGLGDADFQTTTINFCADNTAANTLLNSFVDLQGTVATLIDNFGSSFSVLVLHVDTDNGKRAMIWNGHAAARLVVVRWALCVTA